MKRVTLLFGIGLLLCACNQPQSSNNETEGNNMVANELTSPTGNFSQYIPVDSANRMIESYLTSIDYKQNDSDLYSIIFSADSLKRMLLNPAANIKHIKIMFAHSLEYINRGNFGRKCGYRSGELTVVIAGYNDSNNYVFFPVNKVLEMGAPCPYNCPSSGTASNNTLQ